MADPHPERGSRNSYQVAKVTDDEAISQQPLSEESLKNGRQWIIRQSFTIGTADTLEIFVGVDSDEDDAMRIVSRTVEPDSAINGTITFNRDGYETGTQLEFINSDINGEIDDGIHGTIESGGDYTNPSERDGEVIELPLRSALGVDPEGPELANTRPPSAALYRVSPGGSVHYEIESTEDDNTITLQFIVSQRETV